MTVLKLNIKVKFTNLIAKLDSELGRCGETNEGGKKRMRTLYQREKKDNVHCIHHSHYLYPMF